MTKVFKRWFFIAMIPVAFVACGGSSEPVQPSPSSSSSDISSSTVISSSSVVSSSSSLLVSTSSSSFALSSSSSSIISSVSSSLNSGISISSSSEVPSPVSSISSSSISVSSASSSGALADTLLSDGTFSIGQAGFTVGKSESADIDVTWSGEANFNITNGGINDWEVQLLHDISLDANQQYVLCYQAKADSPRTILVQLDSGSDGSSSDSTAYKTISEADGTAPDRTSLTRAYRSFEYRFTAADSDTTARVNFSLGQSNVSVQLDNIGLYLGDQCGEPAPVSSPSAGGVVGDVIEAESLNQSVSNRYVIEQSNGIRNIGRFGAGSVLCYDDIDLTGVRSIEFSYARNGSDVPTDGRFAILAGGPDPLTASNLGESFTTSTGGWTTFQPLKVGLNDNTIGLTQLCVYGTESGGIGNFDKFTLSAETADNDGITEFDLGVPRGPAVDPITVVGNQVRYGGVAKSIAGMSMFWSAPGSGSDGFYNKETVAWLKQDWGIELIRAAMAVDDKKNGGQSVDDLTGYLTHPFVNQHALEEVVHAAIENGIYVIIDWHAHKAEDSKEQAIEFFSKMARKYGSFNNVIYEIYNEPVDTSWPAIKSYAEDVIAAIRAEDPDNLIVVGTRRFSQEVEEAADNPISNADNIAYTLHFYVGEAAHRGPLIAKARRALSKGAALFVTEWGVTPASGDGAIANDQQLDLWLNFLKNNNISHANWAVSSHNQTSATIKQGASTRGQWPNRDLTEAGRKVKNIIKNWQSR